MGAHEQTDFPDTQHDTSATTTFGFWVYLMTDSIVFATLFAAYAVLRDSTFGGPGGRELFDLHYVLYETILLLVSSFTCGIAMTAIAAKNKAKLVVWYLVTFLLGIGFLTMVGGEFTQLIEKGYTWQKSAFLTSYFTLIGTHALHIVFGLLFILILLGQTIRWGIIPMTIRRLTCLKLFWFYSYLIWIFMFSIVYLIGAQK